ncbi:acetyl-CoA synthetase-like protein [Exidia glandulosa HHB12029]|uniref:Acetyl-CoA synthetase-like protein n=1 Tax=Exidia glandulosa HHB12029 TaxID=1314781 RepID=A0A165JKT4_EXIGL|nr:acetyl-CoA synthetase-like protein [Exidia glandulosa HHB12029]
MTSRDAVHTSPRGLRIPASNVASFLFSNPFRKDEPAIATAPLPSQRAHYLNERVPPHRTLYINQLTGAQLSWDRVRRDAGRVARGLRSLSFLQPANGEGKIVLSPIVMVQLPNCIVYAPVLFGVWAAGLTASTVNPFLTKSELEHVLRLSRPQAIITLAGGPLQTLRDAVAALDDTALRRHYERAGCIFVVDPEDDDYGARARPSKEPHLPGWTVRNWKWLLLDEPAEWVIPPMTEQEAKARIALVMWSSGTSEFDLRTFLELVSTFRATFIHIAPPVALALAKSPLVDRFDLSSVKRAISGGAPLGQEIITEVYKRTGIKVSMGLGMTETSGGTAQQSSLTWEEMQAAPGSTGRFMLGIDAKLIDEEGKVVKLGEPGELLLRSPMNFSCYLNDEKATAAAVTADGWYHSGDVAKMDEHGNVYIVDRLKDVIKYKGLQVAPAELESILCACPLVKDAGVTAVYSHAEATELPRAFVVPTDPSLVTSLGHVTPAQARFADEVRRHVEEHTVKYKWLRGGIVICKEIPTSPSGKRLRKLLKGVVHGTEVIMYPPTAKL